MKESKKWTFEERKKMIEEYPDSAHFLAASTPPLFHIPSIAASLSIEATPEKWEEVVDTISWDDYKKLVDLTSDLGKNKAKISCVLGVLLLEGYEKAKAEDNILDRLFETNNTYYIEELDKLLGKIRCKIGVMKHEVLDFLTAPCLPENQNKYSSSNRYYEYLYKMLYCDPIDTNTTLKSKIRIEILGAQEQTQNYLEGLMIDNEGLPISGEVRKAIYDSVLGENSLPSIEKLKKYFESKNQRDALDLQILLPIGKTLDEYLNLDYFPIATKAVSKEELMHLMPIEEYKELESLGTKGSYDVVIGIPYEKTKTESEETSPRIQDSIEEFKVKIR